MEKASPPSPQGTVTNALHLLDCFDGERRQMSLAQLAELSGYDKPKARRYLLSLMECGFIEQCPRSREYRIGIAVHRLASIRDSDRSLKDAAHTALQQLVAQTGETAHCSLLSGAKLINFALLEPQRTHRISIPSGMVMPLHATSSGMAVMAFSAPDFARSKLPQQLHRYTGATPTSVAEVLDRLRHIRNLGYVLSSDAYEAGVTSIAMPLFNSSGGSDNATGAVSITAPSVRMATERALSYLPALHAATSAITTALGGSYPFPCPASAQAV